LLYIAGITGTERERRPPRNIEGISKRRYGMKEYILAFNESFPGRITHTAPASLEATRRKAAVEIVKVLKKCTSPVVELGCARMVPAAIVTGKKGEPVHNPVLLSGKYWQDKNFVNTLAKRLSERKALVITSMAGAKVNVSLQLSILGIEVEPMIVPAGICRNF
jgi:hypothetical protein